MCKSKIWLDISNGTYGNSSDIVVIDPTNWSDEDFEDFEDMSDGNKRDYGALVQFLISKDSRAITPNEWVTQEVFSEIVGNSFEMDSGLGGGVPLEG